MSKHLVWLWLWFGIGMATYMLKRAYYLVTGPNPVANTYRQFIKVAWIPLTVRTVVDSGIYWACFTPTLLAAGLNYLGWSSMAGVVGVVTQYAVCALFFGLAVDTIADFAISKVPFVNGLLPQMPPPLPPPQPAKP